jgi:hypothetical protein
MARGNIGLFTAFTREIAKVTFKNPGNFVSATGQYPMANVEATRRR